MGTGTATMPEGIMARLRSRGPRWLLANGWQHLRARWSLRAATSVGSARLRGRLRLENHGTTVVGDRVRLDGTVVRLDLYCGPGARLEVGEGTFINYGSSIGAVEGVTIGRNCDIGQYAIILDNDFHAVEDHTAAAPSKPVVIEDDVWLGARVTVLPGAHIGRGAVIGAHAVVRGEVPARTLAVGVPARVVRHL
ncbi:MAG: acyltransferase [Chloroflexi bacterium]|nr:acyltransferase [Chloroflexota bacterium]